MMVGQEVRAGGSKVIVLDIQEKYLILFNEFKRQFIKVNDWHEAYEIVYWNTKEDYFTLEELIKTI